MRAHCGQHSLCAGARKLVVVVVVVVVVVACTWATTARATEFLPRNISNPPGYSLLPGVTQVPAPIPVVPDEQNWAGMDGAWNTFSLRVGSQQTNTSVLVSTAAKHILLVDAPACAQNAQQDCEDSHGRSFNHSQSTTFQELGDYELGSDGYRGLSGTGHYGLDTVRLGADGLTLNSTTIATMGANSTLSTPAEPWLGYIGLQSQATEFPRSSTRESYITQLFQAMSIPSQSFGYTAGARYRVGKEPALASLTLGGYDAARFADTQTNYALDSEQRPVVGLVGLSSQSPASNGFDLFKANTANVAMVIDSTVAEIWFPIEICKAFEEAFGLTYDETTNLYLVDSILHARLLALNPEITFLITNTNTRDIVDSNAFLLPYAAFDLEAQPPYQNLTEATRYFPIRRGTDQSQWILGRTFLQEAYLKVDWERSVFSVHPRVWDDRPSNISAVVSPRYGRAEDDPPISSSPSYPPLSTAWIVGISFGSAIVCLALAAVAWWFWRWRRRRRQKVAAPAREPQPIARPETPPLNSPRGVPDGGKDVRFHAQAELPGAPNEHIERDPFVDPKPAQAQDFFFELPGDMPVSEADGRQLSEKETMVVRERNVNGVDPCERAGSPVSITASTRLYPAVPLDGVAMSGRMSSSRRSRKNHRVSCSTGASMQDEIELPPYRTMDDESRAADNSRRRFSYES
ncbi:hypothetical protein LEMA_P012650.1 [Plenodomus lingam JN3]|uniref:Peptidase A1 domain-containing protein n=1 Tax=Leptosphaeria maculans (strain JN3 / isolate v23.1.3 / race Av1-4-5-6-7-8) TaxID=985895 RepID=E5AC24_LEPMJ|nr:hypothetical protein LEMA_P012650.1 [Plenodomus lingam JN3]CBY00135.1 hypothetical protein LEMA_P012650.1 [Plenodomus lingam JN3]